MFVFCCCFLLLFLFVCVGGCGFCVFRSFFCGGASYVFCMMSASLDCLEKFSHSGPHLRTEDRFVER